MNKRGWKILAALLLAMALLLSILPPALAEAIGDGALPVEAEFVPEEGSSDEIPPELGEALTLGDIGGEAGDAIPEEAPEEGGAILPNASAEPGYFWVTAGAEVYASAALETCVGAFPEGATVYAEAAEAGGAVLRIRFDTDDARAWDDAIPSGYIGADLALALETSEAEALEEALMGDGRTRAAGGVLIPQAVFAATEYAPAVEAEGLGVEARTQAQIQAFADGHPAYAGQVNLYGVAPTEEPYAIGRLSPVNQRSALNLIGQMRYIAGLDADLSLLSEKEEMAASAALVLRLNGALTHYPQRPEALSDKSYDELYRLGYLGAGASNIARGYKATGSILAYMADSDAENLPTVGHRRWILNPALGGTVMGANGSYSAMYAHDQSGAGGQERVAWPAQQMPAQYFSAVDPWSLSFGRELDASKVAVKLIRVSDGAVWRFSAEGSDGDFYVDNHGYGQRGCVIFRPEGLEAIAPGDVFNVSVDDGGGLTRYTVNFFQLNLSAATPPDRVVPSAEKTAAGVSLGWSAVDGATGYYVCRRTADTQYAIVADLAGTSWLDTAADPAGIYAYQVYPHTDSLTSLQPGSVRPTAPEPTGVKLNKTGTVKVYANDTLRLSAIFEPAWAESALTWKSSKTKYAKVDGNGLVTPVKAGTTVISVRTANGLTASVKVKVVTPPKPTKVKLNKRGTVKLKLGEKLQLTATLTPTKAASKLKWSSSNKKVAKVSSTGLVTPVKTGTAKITVKTANGKKASVKVKVVKK